MAKHDDKKLDAFGLLADGNSAKEVARLLSTPYPILLKWKNEYDQLSEKQDIQDVLDIDKIVLHDLALSTKNKLSELTEEGDELVEGVLQKIDQLSTLQVDLQVTAISVLVKVNSLIDECKRADDILTLVDAIAKLQTAFFAKGSNVNVLSVNNPTSSNGISKFKSMQRPM